MIYYISDLHYFDELVVHFKDCRPFASTEEMNRYMIRQWNSRVTGQDTVYVLGDFIKGSGRQANEILRQLAGRICLIVGNHDEYLQDPEFDRSRFEWVRSYAEIKDGDHFVVMSHYPMIFYNNQYRSEEGIFHSVMLHGHIHRTYDDAMLRELIALQRRHRQRLYGYKGVTDTPSTIVNTFCMFSDYIPLTADEWIRVQKKREEQDPTKEKPHYAPGGGIPV